jgi:poly(ADP-ribose) glycohydrolase
LIVASQSGAIGASIASQILGNNRRIEIERLVSDKTHGAEWWMASTALLREIDYKPSFQRIESANDAVQADFANKHLGGGVLRRGCVQEEIRLIISPECLLSVFLCEKMASNEAVLIKNTLMFSDYTGYSSSFTCTGFSKPLVSLFEGNSSELLLDDIVAIDAIPFGPDKNDQYSLLPIVRELEKCRAGLGYAEKKPFATGNWGCGVFGGDSELKAVIQWLAATVSDKSMIYFPFDDRRTARLPELVQVCTRSTNVHVGTLFSALVKGLIDSKIKEGTTIDFLIGEMTETQGNLS